MTELTVSIPLSRERGVERREGGGGEGERREREKQHKKKHKKHKERRRHESQEAIQGSGGGKGTPSVGVGGKQIRFWRRGREEELWRQGTWSSSQDRDVCSRGGGGGRGGRDGD